MKIAHYAGIAVAALLAGCLTHSAPRPVTSIEGFTADDKRVVAVSRFSTVRDAVFANPYQKVWATTGKFDQFPVTFTPLVKGLLPAARRVLSGAHGAR